MVNPGSFVGARKEFLTGEKAAYKLAIESGYVADALADIQRRYFKRFPITLAHDQEPTPEFLASVDDDAPEPEVIEPDEALLDEDEYQRAKAELEVRRKLVTFRKGQIKRWLVYQHMKDLDFDPKQANAKNPYRVMLHQLTGVSMTRPRLRTPVNTWRKTERTTIEAEVRKRVAAGGLARKDIAALRDKVARDLFSRLSKEDRDQWSVRARDEHEALLAQWKQDIEGKPSTTPAGRQRCIQGLVRFMQPILDNVCEATGWKATLITGGPEPANGGRLNVVSIHSGTAPGDIEMNFGRSEQITYKKYIVPSYGRFLQKCYPVEECRARALPDDEEDTFASLAALGLENEGVNVDSINEIRTPTSPPAHSNLQLQVAPLVSSAHPTCAPLPTTSIISPNATLADAPASSNLPESSTRLPSTAPPNRSHNPSPNRSRAPSPNPSRAASPTEDNSSSNQDSDHSCVPSTDTPPLASATCTEHPTQPETLDGHPKNDVGPLPPTTAPALPRVPASVPCDSPAPAPGASPSLVPTQTGISQPQLPGGDSSASPPTLLRTNGSQEETPPMARGSKRLLAAELGDQSPPKRRRSAGSSTTPPSTTARTRSISSARTALPKAPTQKNLRSRKFTHKVVSPAVSTVSKNAMATKDISGGQVPPVDNTPKWFELSATMFASEPLGEKWCALVALWIAFEKKHNYSEIGKLLCRSRPAIVGEWIKRARSSTWRPTIHNISDFEDDFRLWWTSLQPEWRISDGDIVLDSVDGDWEVLRRPGQNGLVSVLAALFYWGVYNTKNNEDQDMWNKVVQDCHTALSHLI